MAVWQFDLHLVPRTKLHKRFNSIPTHIDKRTFNKVNWWRDFTLTSGYSELLSSFLPRGSSWSEEIELWGDMEGDRIEIGHDDKGKIQELYIRVNVADLKTSVIEGISQFAQMCDCLIFTEDAELMEPRADLLKEAVLRSNAARFVTAPHQFLDSLKPGEFER